MSSFFIGLWPLIWHFGLGGLIALAAVAVAILVPGLRLPAIVVAVATFAAVTSYAIGVKNGESRVQAQWDRAVQRAIDDGEAARADAIRTTPRNPTPRELSNDPRNRDR